MKKRAATAFPVHDLIAERWSPRAFEPRTIEPAVLAQLFEAARWAPSSFNEQPWGFVFAVRDDPKHFQPLVECLVPGNQAWAGQASALVLSAARLSFARNDRPNYHAMHDVGLATGNLLLEATHLGLITHPMAGFDHEKARQAAALPEGYAPAAMMAIGYPGNDEQLPEDLRQRELAPRVRKPLEEFAFNGRWLNPATWVASP